MRYMFSSAWRFNQPLDGGRAAPNSAFSLPAASTLVEDHSTHAGFDTRKVTSMEYMFFSASAFNQPLDSG